jgi:hypothetical protein
MWAFLVIRCNWTSTFQWYESRLDLRMESNMWVKDVRLRAQNIPIILDSIVKTNGGTYIFNQGINTHAFSIILIK